MSLDIMMNEMETKKVMLREKYILIRNNINNKMIKSKKIINKVIENEEFKKAKVVALYKSLTSEVNTTELIKYSINIGKIVALPKVVDNELEFYKINSANDKLIKSKFGIEEPIENKMNFVDKHHIDLVIVPGLCFDKEKNRLGFGKGYYDRFLMNTDLKTIAICFHEQMMENQLLPTTKYDVKMQQIITDDKIYS